VLLDLVPESSVICLGEGDPDETIQTFFQKYVLTNPERICTIPRDSDVCFLTIRMPENIKGPFLDP
jgi:hypothetical protein